jgi:glycosyltransferase involved in cell wall biosynthesis
MVLTFNEEENVRYTLSSVGWAKEVFVLDSFSTDRTKEICAEYDVERGGNVRFFEHAFENYGTQRNYAIEELPWTAEWLLVLDADEVVTPELARELVAIAADPGNPVAGYFVRRRFIFLGRWLKRTGIYSSRIMRFVRRATARYERTVNERLVVDGPTGCLENDLLHENHKGVADWIAKHNRYSTFEAAEYYKLRKGRGEAPPPFRDVFRSREARIVWRKRLYMRMPFRPLVVFFYVYIWRMGFLEGKAGLYYAALQFAHALHVSAKLYELTLEREAAEREQSS